MNIYVGNLASDVTDEELRKLFEPFGQITSVNIIKDKFSGQSRGFGFVEMTNKNEAQAAIEGLKSKSLKERTLVINEARPKTEGGRGGGGGGRPYGGGGSGGNRGGGGFGGGRRRDY